MRESLFEKLKKRKLTPIFELAKFNNLLGEHRANKYYSTAFKASPYGVYSVSLDHAMFDIFESDNEYIQPFKYDTLEEMVQGAINEGADLTLDSFLDYLELLRTLSDLGDRLYCDANAKQIESMVINDCERLGYTFRFDGDSKTYKTMLKNPEAEAVALKVEESTRDKIYKYLMIRKENIDDKRACIKSLADDVEVICEKYSSIAEYRKLEQFIQCTRHTKAKPKKEFPFYYEDEEKWLDKTFDMIIGILSFTKTKEIVAEIKKLEKDNNTVE